jgi:hypothetical protein
MEKSFNSSDEMFVLSKYKYITNTVKNVVQSSNLISAVSKDLSEKSKKEDAELAKKLKEEKKLKMAEACKPGANKEKKTKYVVKEKYINETPKGEKKGKHPLNPRYVETNARFL